VTDGERYNKVVDIWSHANEKVAKVMMDALGTDKVLDDDGSVLEQKSFNKVL
jgi:DNA-directed RNA polymerase subunit beta'